MSEFGQIIDPYRSAPAQGGLLEEILRFAGMTAQLDQQRRLETERMGTNQMINDQKGWSGVDPFKVQQFDQGQQNMQIAGAQEGRAAQDWQQKQEFAKGYVPNAQGMLTGSQFLESLRGLPANPYLAQTIMGALGQRDQKGVEKSEKQGLLQQELQMRQQMNNADNIAETERAKAVAGIQAQSERDRLSDMEAIKLRQMKGATDYLKSNIDDPMLTGGDIAMRFGMNDTSAAMYFNSEIDRLRKAKKAQADAAANAEHANRGSSSLPLPMTRKEADEQRNIRENEAYNQRKGYWRSLESKQYAMIYDKDGNTTKEGLQLLDQIKQQVLYNNAVKGYHSAIIGSQGQAKIPYPTNDPGYPIEDWRRIMPQIVKMIEEANSSY